MSITDQRAAAVAATIETARGIVAQMGVTRAALDALKPVLVALGERGDLFPPEHFRIPAGRANGIFHLAEDADGSFALYGSAGLPGAKQLPHDHTTWAVIAGVFGDEHNVFYRRSDDGSVPGRGTLERIGETTVRKGSACTLMPDDFHTIETRGDGPKLHLHLYGRTLEDLPGRIGFESDAGGAYRRFMAKPEIVSPLVTAPELRAMLGDGAELALLDVREEGVFAKAHLLTAANLPLSRLEMRLDAMVPRRSTRIVLCDDDQGPHENAAQRAAAIMRRFGYRHISVLAGGVGAWKAAGFELFSGVYVPSKAFGEFIEHECGTPRIGAAELKAKIDAGEDVVILDSRPMDEFRVMNIPGAADCPGAELVYRVHEVVKRPETLVVVNCAGRTRSIIGAQSLINAGIPNKVVALKNGTMGWHLAGLPLEHGATRHAPAPGESALAMARAASARVAERFGVRRIGVAELDRTRADPSRTLYCFDVRSPDEYRAGHRAGFASAPGGQLVQATDVYAAVRNARIVLADTDGVRATMTASWLLQMGWPEVHVLDHTAPTGTLVQGAGAPRVLGLDGTKPDEIDAPALKRLLDAGEATLVDFATSLEYRDAHIPGAHFAVRSRLRVAFARIDPAKRYVFTSPSGTLAQLAALDAGALTDAPVQVLAGGTASWKAAGFPLEAGSLAAETDDVYYKPYDRRTQIEQAMQDYLDWEVTLVEQLKREPYLAFRTAHA
ncbi:MAG TPA: rhodanese-like domain-containing protein [Burkholderiales bacterium]|nr:rhodanese-like domain-containing protein [Burkholderiales bacterium]